MNRCSMPHCYLEDFHDGDHAFGRPPRPRGEIRCTQEFRQLAVLTPPCDLHNIPKMLRARDAIGMFDELGFGWQLCFECVKTYGGLVPLAPAPAAPTTRTAPARSPRARAGHGMGPRDMSRGMLRAMKRLVDPVSGAGITSMTISTPGLEPVVIDAEGANNIRRNVDDELRRRRERGAR
jgi:hypothetical protein